MRPEDHKFEVSLSYIVRDCLKKSHPTLDMTAQDLNPSAQKAEAAASVPLRSGRSSQWRSVKGHLKASHFLHSWGWPWTPSLVSPSQGQGCRWVSVTTLGSLEIFKLHFYDWHTLYISHFFYCKIHTHQIDFLTTHLPSASWAVTLSACPSLDTACHLSLPIIMTPALRGDTVSDTNDTIPSLLGYRCPQRKESAMKMKTGPERGQHKEHLLSFEDGGKGTSQGPWAAPGRPKELKCTFHPRSVDIELLIQSCKIISVSFLSHF